MPPRVTVVIPTLLAGEPLARCLRSLAAQSYRDFETIVVDNSGQGAASACGDGRPIDESAVDPGVTPAGDCPPPATAPPPIAGPAGPRVRVIPMQANVGFGAAINLGIESSSGEFICTLNDDAYPAPGWLASLVDAAEEHPEAGMLACQIRLASQPEQLDSAGLGIYGDGTTKQRGHGEPARYYASPEEVLIPSGCAALYRRSVLERVGVFDADYFLYCEDTDLGLRARLAGWRCLYVPGAVVEHDYSVSSGRASRLKAYYVERNRLYTVVKDFPVLLWPLAPFYSLWRYLLHFWALLSGRGLAAEFTRGGEKWWRLVLIVGSAHAHALRHLPELLAKRRNVRKSATLSAWAFWKLMRRHSARAWRIVVQ